MGLKTKLERREDGSEMIAALRMPRPNSWRQNLWGTDLADSRIWRDAFASHAEMVAAAGLDAPMMLSRAFGELPADHPSVVAGGKRAILAPEMSCIRLPHNGAPGRVMGFVSPKYELLTPLDGAAALDHIGGQPSVAASLNNGRSFYITSRVDKVNIRDGSTVERYIFLRGFHGGAGSLIIGETDLDPACANKLREATLAVMASAAGETETDETDRVQGQKIPHKSGALILLENVAAAYRDEMSRRAAEMDEYRAMAARKLSRGETTSAIATIAGVDRAAARGTKAAVGRANNLRDEILSILDAAAPRTGVLGDGSAFDVFSAVTAYTTQRRTVSGAKDDASAAAFARDVEYSPMVDTARAVLLAL